MTPSDEWGALFDVISNINYNTGPQELEFEYETHTDGLSDVLQIIVEYDYKDEAFNATDLSGCHTTYPDHMWDILSVTAWVKGYPVEPESLEPGLTKLIKEEALNRIQSL